MSNRMKTVIVLFFINHIDKGCIFVNKNTHCSNWKQTLLAGSKWKINKSVTFCFKRYLQFPVFVSTTVDSRCIFLSQGTNAPCSSEPAKSMTHCSSISPVFITLKKHSMSSPVDSYSAFFSKMGQNQQDERPPIV